MLSKLNGIAYIHTQSKIEILTMMQFVLQTKPKYKSRISCIIQQENGTWSSGICDINISYPYFSFTIVYNGTVSSVSNGYAIINGFYRY